MLSAPSERRIAMTTEKYLISSPTIALVLEDGRQVAHLVPEGAMIRTDGKPFNGNKLIEVTWAEKVVMMFTQDLRARGKKID
jgi:hypothetical protein